MRIIRKLREGIRETLSDPAQMQAMYPFCSCLLMFVLAMLMALAFPLLVRLRAGGLRAILDLLGF